MSTEGLAVEHSSGKDILITCEIPEHWPPELREGLVRRRLCITQGRCPCGAEFTRPNREQRRAAIARRQVIRVNIEHEHDCPAVDPRLDRLNP